MVGSVHIHFLSQNVNTQTQVLFGISTYLKDGVRRSGASEERKRCRSKTGLHFVYKSSLKMKMMSRSKSHRPFYTASTEAVNKRVCVRSLYYRCEWSIWRTYREFFGVVGISLKSTLGEVNYLMRRCSWPRNRHTSPVSFVALNCSLCSTLDMFRNCYERTSRLWGSSSGCFVPNVPYMFAR